MTINHKIDIPDDLVQYLNIIYLLTAPYTLGPLGIFMTCVNWRVNPSTITKLRLFADSGGFCANPKCLSEIFVDHLSSGPIHIAEIAHVISAGDSGPRSNTSLTNTQRSEYDNLILLCPTCHTIIDKAESDYPVEQLLYWKNNHKQIIAKAFGTHTYSSREEVKTAITPLLNENRYIFDTYGPMSNERFNPESEMPEQWLRKIRTKIIPNNRKILALCEANSHLITSEETTLLLAFQQHVDDFEAKHLGESERSGEQFPNGFENIFT